MRCSPMLEVQQSANFKRFSTVAGKKEHFPRPRERQIPTEAIMEHILKKAKDAKMAISYHTINLASCTVKTLERIVNKHPKWYLEVWKLLATK